MKRVPIWVKRNLPDDRWVDLRSNRAVTLVRNETSCKMRVL